MVSCCCDEEEEQLLQPFLNSPQSQQTSSSLFSSAIFEGGVGVGGEMDPTQMTISPMNSNFSALFSRDTLWAILEKLPLSDLARAACVCRIWNSVASDREIQIRAFKSPWKLKDVVGHPSSSSFWRDNSISKFAISHRILRGDTVAGLAVKYSVQNRRKMATRCSSRGGGGASSSRGVGSSGGGRSMNINDAIGAYLLHNILSRLPAKSFASAACVNRSWNSICTQILSSPKLSSAFSLNPSPEEAVNEVLEKVLLEPIRPQFAIVHAGPNFYPTVHRVITEKLGSEIPVVTSVTQGIIGRDAQTDEFKEIMWKEDDDEYFGDYKDLALDRGILLTVGYLPGVKTNLIPLSSRDQDLQELLIDEFVKDVREYASSVSGSPSPSAVILFADHKADMKPVLRKLDYAFPSGTIIVGEGGGRSSYRSSWQRDTRRQRNYIVPAIALVFANDRNKSPGTGETQFHVALSTGTIPVGPKYKVASVKERYRERCTWLTARRVGVHENLDGQTILDNIHDEIGEHLQAALYVGIRKRRKCSIGLEKVRWQTFLEFHEILGGNEEYLFVNDVGIRTGDSFQLYASDPNFARSTCNHVSEHLKHLKDDCVINGKTSVFGGFIFACCGRGESFFGRPNTDAQPFLENFLGVTIAGSFCNGEIKHGHTSDYGQEDQEGSTLCSVHVFSTVYLLLSYIQVQNPDQYDLGHSVQNPDQYDLGHSVSRPISWQARCQKAMRILDSCRQGQGHLLPPTQFYENVCMAYDVLSGKLSVTRFDDSDEESEGDRLRRKLKYKKLLDE